MKRIFKFFFLTIIFGLILIAVIIFYNPELTEQRIIKSLQTDKKQSERIKAIERLRFKKSKKAVDAIIQALKNEDKEIRWRAARALYLRKSERAIKPLLKALKDNEEKVRICAAGALENINPDTINTIMIHEIKNENKFIRSAAARILGRNKVKEASDQLIIALKIKRKSYRRLPLGHWEK